MKTEIEILADDSNLSDAGLCWDEREDAQYTAFTSSIDQ